VNIIILKFTTVIFESGRCFCRTHSWQCSCCVVCSRLESWQVSTLGSQSWPRLTRHTAGTIPRRP